jgi:hypothetical protein
MFHLDLQEHLDQGMVSLQLEQGGQAFPLRWFACTVLSGRLSACLSRSLLEGRTYRFCLTFVVAALGESLCFYVHARLKFSGQRGFPSR